MINGIIVQNDPINRIDPWGLMGEEVGKPFVPLSITPNAEADALREGAEPTAEATELQQLESSEEAALIGMFSSKAPYQVTPGIESLQGQYINNLGQIQPWEAYYDEYGRLIGRTDYNAGNEACGIADTHYHTYEWGPGKTPMPTQSHVPGKFPGDQ